MLPAASRKNSSHKIQHLVTVVVADSDDDDDNDCSMNPSPVSIFQSGHTHGTVSWSFCNQTTECPCYQCFGSIFIESGSGQKSESESRRPLNPVLDISWN